MTDAILQRARLLVKQFEGCRLQAYQDQAGVWTIGWGQTGKNVVQGTTWTQEQADAALDHTLSFLWGRIDHDVQRDLNVNQAAAVLSLAYNIGLAALERSTLWGYLQAGQWEPAAAQFTLWDKVRTPGGSMATVPGLLKRRQAEQALFRAAP